MSGLIPTSLNAYTTKETAYAGEPVYWIVTMSVPAGYEVPATAPVTFLVVKDFSGEFYIYDATLINGLGQLMMIVSNPSVFLVTARFAGDGIYAASEAFGFVQQFEPGPVSGTITVEPDPPIAGAVTDLLINLTPIGYSATITGQVKLIIDGNEIEQKTMTANDDNTLTFQYVFMTSGPHAIMFDYSGSDAFLANQFSKEVIVGPQPTELTISVSPSQSWIDHQATITVNISSEDSAGPINGTVEINIDGFVSTADVVNGQASIEHTFTEQGTFTITATFTPAEDSSYAESSGSTQHTVIRVPTTTEITSGGTPSMVGATVTFTAVVTAEDGSTPSGSVEFVVDGGTSETRPLLDGIATYETSTLSGGLHNVVATYTGTDKYADSSDNVVQTVNRYPTTTVLTVTPSLIQPGGTTTFAVEVTGTAGQAPTGSVTIYNGLHMLVTIPLNSEGKGETDQQFEDEGTYSINAVYNGDNLYNQSQNNKYLVVGRGNVNVELQLSPNPSIFGQNVAMTATVVPVDTSGVPPTGTVTFYVDGNVLDEVDVTEGVAILTTNTLSIGPHNITNRYNGDDNYIPATSPQMSQRVTGTTVTVTSVASEPDPSMPGENVVLTAKVTSSGNPVTEGNVTFYYLDQILGTGIVNMNGEAGIVGDSLPEGTLTIRAVYNGTDTYAFSEGTSEHEVRGALNTTTELVDLQDPTYVGDPARFTATVRVVDGEEVPTGSVTFYVDGNLAVTLTLTNGSANFETSFDNARTYIVQALYVPNDDRFNGSESNEVEHDVIERQDAFITLTSNYNPSWYGQMVTFNALVRPSSRSPHWPPDIIRS